MALIELQGISIAHHDKVILNGVNFSVDEGEFIYIVGAVGSGKSTLLKALYAEIPLKKGAGEVLEFNLQTLKQRHVPELRRQLGIVFQDFRLLHDHTVAQNLDFVLRATGWNKRKLREERIEEVLKAVGLSEKGDKFPHELSGGEQQRTAIARALLNKPKVILADEPTGNLDNESSALIMNILRTAAEQGTAVVMVTHNLNLLQQYPGIVYRCEDETLTEMTQDYYKPISYEEFGIDA